MTPKIIFDKVTRRFELGAETFVALDRFSLEIADGEFVTVVGPSGCGKSTALNIAGGLLEASEGSILVDGKPVNGPSPERGVIFQQYALFPWLTVRQNVEFGLKLRGDPAPRRREIAQRFIDLVGLSHFADALPRTLSGGMKQRCAIARAYAVDPVILLMDEPFGALDALTRVQLQDQLLETWTGEPRANRDRRTDGTRGTPCGKYCPSEKDGPHQPRPKSRRLGSWACHLVGAYGWARRWPADAARRCATIWRRRQ